MGENWRPPATGYPYPAPQPAQPVYNNYNPNPRANIYRRIFVLIIAAVILVTAFLFISWLVLRPRVPEFRVDRMSLSNFNLNTSFVTGNWDVRLTARNPNGRTSMYYDRVQASLFYRDVPLAYSPLPPLVQGRKDETALRATFAAAGAYVDKWVVEGISNERSTTGMIGFNVRLAAVVKFGAGVFRARRRFLRVYCPDLNVRLLSSTARNGSLVSEVGRRCRVEF